MISTMRLNLISYFLQKHFAQWHSIGLQFLVRVCSNIDVTYLYLNQTCEAAIDWQKLDPKIDERQIRKITVCIDYTKNVNLF